MKIPESTHPFYHHQPIQMRFADIDVFNHVNNNVYMQYMDLGKLEYINTVLGQLFDPRKKAMVVASLKCEFYNPTVYGENIEVLTRVDSVGEHSLHLEQRVINSDNGQVKCVCASVMVGFDVVTAQSMVIPTDWRECISHYEHRKV